MEDVEFNRLLAAGLSLSEVMQVQKGYRSEADIRLDRRIRDESGQWVGVPVNDWPPFEVRWNIEPDCYHRSLDGESKAQFDAAYPDVVVMEACPHEIVAALPESRRRTEEPWEGEYKDKTAKVIAAWTAGIDLTPPVLVPYGDWVMLAGGWHRFHVAMRKGALTVKVLVQQSAIAAIRRAVPSLAVPAG